MFGNLFGGKEKIPELATIIPQSMVLTGKLEQTEANTPMFIDGIVKLSEDANLGIVNIGTTGKVIGNINGSVVTISGEITGNIVAETVKCLGSARVYGNITASRLTVEGGATLKGSVSIGNVSETVPTKQKVRTSDVMTD